MFLFVHGEAGLKGNRRPEAARSRRKVWSRPPEDTISLFYCRFCVYVTFWPVWFLLWFSDSKVKPVLVKHRVGYYRENEGTGQRASSIFGFKVMLQYRRWVLTIQTTFRGSLYLSDQTFFPNQTGLRHLLDKTQFYISDVSKSNFIDTLLQTTDEMESGINCYRYQ